jgi:hypothetical protein
MSPYPEEGKGNDGDGCFGHPSCNPGLDCIGAQQQNGCNEDACCTPFCDLTGDGSECTDPMETCVSYFVMGQAPEGLEHVGVCLLP